MLKTQQSDLTDRGQLTVNVTNNLNIPIQNATISISYSGIPDNILEQIVTDRQGFSPSVELNAPPIELSLDESNIIQPYAEYSIYVEAPGYEPKDISGIEILSDTASMQLQIR